MEITKPGKNCFRIKGKKAIILIEPSSEIKNLTAHIIISSSLEKSLQLKGEPVVIFGPGEYEIMEINILGIKEKFATIYKIAMDNLSLLYIENLEEKIPEEKVEVLNQVDILLLPASKSKVASSLVSQLEPSVIIPTDEEKFDEFLKEIGIEKAEKMGKFIVSKGELTEERKVIKLKTKN